MNIAEMKKILKDDYGICDEAELCEAMSRSAGINLGIFTMPLIKKNVIREQEKC